MTTSRTFSRNLCAASALIAPLMLHSAAFAQTASAPETSSTGAFSTDDIIVTANRRVERLEEVPASIVAVTGEVLEAAGVKRFQDLALVAPGVQISRSGIYTQPAIRGVSTIFAGPAQETNVAVYVDGFYTADNLSINQDFANVQDVQVLKGPQGTLYGRNATGGAILITTRGPTDELTFNGSVSYAPRFNDRIASAFVAGPITDAIKFSVAGYFRKNDGYIKDINRFSPNVPLDTADYTFGGHGFVNFADHARRGGSNAAPFENWSIRPKLEFDASPNLKVTLGYVHARISDARALAYGPIGQLSNNFIAVTQGGVGIPAGQPVPADSYGIALRQRDRTSLNMAPVSDSTLNEYNATVEWKLGELGVVTSRTAYRDQRDFQVYDLDGTPRDPGTTLTAATYNSDQFNRRQTFVQQFDYSGSFGNLQLLAGAFYYKDKFRNDAYEDVGNNAPLSATFPANPTLSRLHFHTKSWAVYLDGTYSVGDKLFITLGGRYARDEKSLDRVRYTATPWPAPSTLGYFVPSESTVCYTGGYPSTFVAACDQPFSKRIAKGSFTPHAVIRYNLSQGTNIYASVSRGFRAGTIQGGSPFNALKPETVTAYEMGIKTAQGGFHADLSAFYYDYKNNQVVAFNGSTAVAVNAGGAHTYGLDGALSYRFPDDHLNLRASFAYLHARYTDFGGALNKVVVPSAANAEGAVSTSVVGSWTGRRLVRAPDWTGSVGADYTFDDVAGGKLQLAGTASFTSHYAPQDASYQCTRVGHDTAGGDITYVAGTTAYCAAGTDTKKRGLYETSGFAMVNAQITWTDPSEHYSITVFGDNVTNTRYKVVSSAFAYFSYNLYNEPRTIGAKLGVKF